MRRRRPSILDASWTGAGELFRALLPGGVALLAFLGRTDRADAAADSVKATIKGGVLTVAGTPGVDPITLRLQAGDPNTLEVDVGADGTADFRFNRQLFNAIAVNGRAGNDTIIADRSNGSFTDTATTFDGGDGNDTLIGANGEERLVGGAGDDFLDGNQGVDSVAGGDGVDLVQWDPGDGSDIVDGCGGADRLVLNGSGANEIFDLAAVADHVRLSRNVGLVALDLDGIDTIELRTAGGTDTVTVNDLSGTDLTEIDTDLAAVGGTAADSLIDEVIVNGTAGDDAIAVVDDGSAVAVRDLAATVRMTGTDPTLDRLTVNGLAGNDEITATPEAGALILLKLMP